MSDRYLIYSDLHIHNHSQDWRRVEDALEVLDWIYKEAVKREVKTVFFLGDFFHVRGYMYPSIVAKSYRKLLEFKNAGIDMHLLVGNHDMPYKASTKHNCITAFDSVADVIEQPMVFEGTEWDFYYMPYVEDQEQLEWAINKIYQGIHGGECRNGNTITRKKEKHPTQTKKTALLAHLDIYNAVYHNTGTRSTHGVVGKFLTNKFDVILTGHYHTHQQILDNIWYIGSPYQQNFSEAHQQKGIVFFNEGKIEFIENTFSPQFMYLKPDQIDERVHNNYIKILADKNDNIAALREQALLFEPRNVSVSIGGSKEMTDEKLINLKSSAKDVKMLLKEWVEKHANEDLYDKDVLLKTGYSIVEGVASDIQ